MTSYSSKERQNTNQTVSSSATRTSSSFHLQDNRPRSVMQRQVIQLSRNPQPGGNPLGRGGKGQKQKLMPPPVRQIAEQIVPVATRTPAARGNPLQHLINLSDIKIKSKDHQRIHKLLAKTGEYFNEPHMMPAKFYLEGLQETLSEKSAPTTVKLHDIKPDASEHGYYNRVNKKLSLGILNPEAARDYSEAGYGAPEESLAEVGVHEYTHVLDLETLRKKSYRAQALGNMNQSLPFSSAMQPLPVNEARMKRMREVGGLLDPHIDLTIAQGMLMGGSHIPLLSELMANFAELGAAKDPISHLMMRDPVHQQDGETDHAYQQRITGDYDLLMQQAVLPYVRGIVNDHTLPKNIRDYFLQAAMRVPTSGHELHAAVTGRKAALFANPAFQAAIHQHRANQGAPGAQALADHAKKQANLQSLRQKIKEKKDQRRRK